MSTLWNVETLVGVRLGSCVLERPLGAGGMGAVYLAQQERPRRQVAVKVLRPRSPADQRSWATFLARFRREADATAALDHANIVPIYEFGEREDLAYLIMPYLADGSLAALLARMGPLPLTRAAAYAAQTAAALDYAHGRGIIHRDVKPSNLLLHPDGRLLLADFGIARALDRPEPRVPDGLPLSGEGPLDDAALTQAGAVVGTPHYMAPELIRGEPATVATDVYALGALTFTMLAGQPPFGEGTTVEVLRRQVAGDPLPLRALRLDAPPALEEVIHAALARRPAGRPASAGAFARALRQAIRAKPSSRLVVPSSTVGATSSFVPRSHGRPVDAPTLPRPSVDARDAARGARHDLAFHDDATLYDPAGMPGSAPAWPISPSRDARRGGGSKGPFARLFPAGAIAAAGAVVLALIFVFVTLGFAGAPSPGRTSSSAGAHILPTPTATQVPTATPSPTPVINWLSVSPTSVSLGCSSPTKSAAVVLRNLGPDQVWWSADVPWLGGIGVSPGLGPLPTDNSVTITLTNTSIFFGHHGTISFRPTDKRAGQAAALTYSTQAC